ncbi:aldo/keto reductase [Ramlibacter sp. AW1]|uniref:Aldo/keto reductase n=1 Tax=Ramlibacter aurantiacus TaxID=2801330 RepID=A0A936ZJ06_9BURK|nr:aldo/keto reductase [Ramlibacter aurantiacus]MBL0421093.1 aldo/keto reductase [Ramlibacter aurantiacus]
MNDTPEDLQQRVTAIGLALKNDSGMEYRHVGRSGLVASALGVGCFPFGGFVDQAGTRAVVDQALELGINYFDTANSYGIGRSEEALGLALERRRHKAVIATKFGNRTGDGPNDTGASRMALIAACEASLKRLRTDYIDLYQLHWPDHDTPVEETLRALDDLVRAGKVRYIGASNHYAWELCEAWYIAEMKGLTKFVSTQDHHSLLYRDIEKRFEPFCIKYGIGMTHYFPLASGMLSGAHTRGHIAPGTRQAENPHTAAWQSERNWSVQEKLAAFARERGWTLPQMSLAWLLQRPATFTVIAGADKPEHLRENVKALQVKFTEQDLVEIDRITLVDEDRSVAPAYRGLRPEKIHEFDTLQRAKATNTLQTWKR